MTNELVFVCTPCYNAESYAGLAIESILAQTWPRVEIIVVNDQSIYGISDVIRRYRSEKFEQIEAASGTMLRLVMRPSLEH